MPLGILPCLYISLDFENRESRRAGFSLIAHFHVVFNNKVWLILFPSSLQDGVEQLIHKQDEEMGH